MEIYHFSLVSKPSNLNENWRKNLIQFFLKSLNEMFHHLAKAFQFILTFKNLSSTLRKKVPRLCFIKALDNCLKARPKPLGYNKHSYNINYYYSKKGGSDGRSELVDLSFWTTFNDCFYFTIHIINYYYSNKDGSDGRSELVGLSFNLDDV